MPITGETGAGKSIIIGALDLLLGDRADHTLIRAGSGELFRGGGVRTGARRGGGEKAS